MKSTTSRELVQGLTGPGSSIAVPSIDEQVARFLASPPDHLSSNSSHENARPLFFLLGGGNDVLFNPNITASRSVQVLLRLKDQLQVAYPEGDFVFLDYPNFARIPYSFYLSANGGSSDGVSASISKRVLATFFRELKALYEDVMLDGIRSSTGGLNNMRFVDIMPLFEEFDYYGEPEQYGMDPFGAYGSCLVGVYQETGSDNVTVCESPDRMAFWDEYHPTTHAHSWVARRVLDVLGF
ncbi:hypothetical protein D9758_013468 [Tetrapyrgos nigripes]|uniref:Uncharacterized protein n=1 Tax=Tetrapyrgos nigripes TaxID=182062 RepID=A0A8H5CTZ5_9AGAR|nr:hypothetical protein D9758_013468 [Tetrapyrgos nigripes]